jgi:hypothetical protein
MATAAMIRERFGDRVADIVLACSDSLSDAASWRERKEAYLAHLAHVDPSVALVSASDKVHNARSIVTFGNKAFRCGQGLAVAATGCSGTMESCAKHWRWLTLRQRSWTSWVDFISICDSSRDRTPRASRESGAREQHCACRAAISQALSGQSGWGRRNVWHRWRHR